MDGDEATVWRRAGGLLTRRTSRSVLIATVPATSGTTVGSREPLVLEGAAVAVWDALEDPVTDEQLVAGVAARFDVPADVVRRDVRATRAVLCDHGALVATDD